MPREKAKNTKSSGIQVLSKKERSSYRPESLENCLAHLQKYFDAFAVSRDSWRRRNLGYHLELLRYYRYHIPAHASVLEMGCGTGDLLSALEPACGVGVDISPAMIERAKVKYPSLSFICGAAETVDLKGQTFDYIILSDLLMYSYDIRALFSRLRLYCHARTRIIVNTYSQLWQPVLSMAEICGLKYRQPLVNWVTREDIANMGALAGFEVVQSYVTTLLPKRLPLLSFFCNRVLAPFAPFRWFCLINWIVLRLPLHPLQRSTADAPREPSVSVICPCRNEAGNIPRIAERLPRMGAHTELIYVEGHSQDGTLEACYQTKDRHPGLDISVYQQTGKGKKDAVWLGYVKATGDIVMILDADMTVPPEDLVAFYEALVSGRAEFVNGSRLVYPMEGQAMRILNLLGNKFFSLCFSFIIGQPIKDTLCGTKVLLRSDVQRLLAGQSYFGQFDPFGDFDLIFGAAKLSLKIMDLPIRYRDRIYGSTQISRFSHGWQLLKMAGFGLLRMRMR
jgi:SAM-dependent methyltransferase